MSMFGIGDDGGRGLADLPGQIARMGIHCPCGALFGFREDLHANELLIFCSKNCSPPEVLLTLVESHAIQSMDLRAHVVRKIEAIAGRATVEVDIRIPPAEPPEMVPFTRSDEQFFANLRVEEKRRTRGSS